MRLLLDSGPFSLIVLGGGHDLSENVHRLSDGQAEYIRVEVDAWKRWGARGERTIQPATKDVHPPARPGFQVQSQRNRSPTVSLSTATWRYVLVIDTLACPAASRTSAKVRPRARAWLMNVCRP